MSLWRSWTSGWVLLTEHWNNRTASTGKTQRKPTWRLLVRGFGRWVGPWCMWRGQRSRFLVKKRVNISSLMDGGCVNCETTSPQLIWNIRKWRILKSNRTRPDRIKAFRSQQTAHSSSRLTRSRMISMSVWLWWIGFVCKGMLCPNSQKWLVRHFWSFYNSPSIHTKNTVWLFNNYHANINRNTILSDLVIIIILNANTFGPSTTGTSCTTRSS